MAHGTRTPPQIGQSSPARAAPPWLQKAIRLHSETPDGRNLADKPTRGRPRRQKRNGTPVWDPTGSTRTPRSFDPSSLIRQRAARFMLAAFRFGLGERALPTRGTSRGDVHCFDPLPTSAQRDHAPFSFSSVLMRSRSYTFLADASLVAHRNACSWLARSE